MIPENIKNLLKTGNVIFLATSSKESIPNLVAAESCGISDDKILVADCHFKKTEENIKENNKISILITDNNEYFQIKGTSEYRTEGKEFENISKNLEGTGFTVKGVLVITCEEIYDLQKYTKIL